MLIHNWNILIKQIVNIENNGNNCSMLYNTVFICYIFSELSKNK